MVGLLLAFLLIWLFIKLGVGIFKILFFILTCTLAFIFFIHLLVPIVVILGLIFLFFTLARH
ncbi:hypothetical protein ERK19_08645 [Lactobacillus helsingborgensis]|nr:hypothetical protein DLD54_00445 [Lactobacillus helsingborgensis]MBC6357418.1 hypothetical protein [Lactobacillus helsingborgensis]RMC54840.1 hypothetical protein F5ESL0262_00445 [Lactobacillus sp. ESL0262]